MIQNLLNHAPLVVDLMLLFFWAWTLGCYFVVAGGCIGQSEGGRVCEGGRGEREEPLERTKNQVGERDRGAAEISGATTTAGGGDCSREGFHQQSKNAGTMI